MASFDELWRRISRPAPDDKDAQKARRALSWAHAAAFASLVNGALAVLFGTRKPPRDDC